MSALSPSDFPAYAASISNKKQKPLGWGSRPALLIVDVDQAYFSESSPASLLKSTSRTSASLPATVSSLVSAARAGSCPVVWACTRFTNAQLRDAGLWAQKVPAKVLGVFNEKQESGLVESLEGLSPVLDVVDGAKTVPDLVIYKKFVSAFFGTNLASQLTMLGVDTLVVSGARTGGEIRQSVLDAQGMGFRSMVRSLSLDLAVQC